MELTCLDVEGTELVVGDYIWTTEVAGGSSPKNYKASLAKAEVTEVLKNKVRVKYCNKLYCNTTLKLGTSVVKCHAQ
jgi:hypothetical protein